MGKRELLLILAFVVIGAVVYQATAPPPGPNERSFSLSRLVEHVRREMRGYRASAQETRTYTHELDASIAEIQIAGSFVELTINGEDRPNVEVAHRVSSTGYDDAEAKDLVEQTFSKLKLERGGPSLRIRADYPRPGSQRAHLTLKVPRRITVRIDGGGSRTTIAGVAATELTIRGEAMLKNIAGRAAITHRGGRLTIDDVGALKLTGRGSDVRVAKIRGDASFSMESGELEAAAIIGPVEVDAQNVDVNITALESVQKPIRVSAVGGSIKLQGIRGEARVEGRNTEVDVAMMKPAALAVSNEGDEPITITLPPGGLVIDALATDSRITLPDELHQQVTLSGEPDKEQRAAGAVRGGGPTITLRANRGEIRLRSHETTPPTVERPQ